ncbi:MAG: rRNA maturation RNase YbeY [Pirellulales bacterium]
MNIEISDQQSCIQADRPRMLRAAEAILRDAGASDAQLSIALVDDPTIHALNRRFLAHDYPTDVLSFLLHRDGVVLEGEVIASAETARRAAAGYGWTADDELLLYVVHGTLHLVGHDDASDEQREAMRAREREYLALVGVRVRGESSSIYGDHTAISDKSP